MAVAADKYGPSELESPVTRRVVPAAWGVLAEVSRGIRCTAAGTLVIRLAHETTPQAEAFAAGELLPYRVAEIVEAGSSGIALSDIRFLY